MKGKRLIVATLFVLLTVFMTALPAYSKPYKLFRSSKPGDVIYPGFEDCKHDFVESKTKLPEVGTMYHSKDWCVKFSYKKCRKCKMEVVTNVSPYRHKLYIKKQTNPTCVKKGVVEYYCRYCQNDQNKPVKRKYKKSLGHKYKKVVKAATCEKDGYVEQKCTRKGCNHIKNRQKIEHKGHNPKLVREERFINGKKHITKYYICTKCLKYIRPKGNGYVAVSSKQAAIP